MKKNITLTVLLFLTLALMGTQAFGKTIRLTIGAGHPAGPAIWVGTIKNYLVPETNKRLKKMKSAHKIKWREAYGGTVAKLGGVLEAVETGVLDMGLVAYPFEPAKLFLHNFSYYVPFGTPDPIQAYRIGAKLHKEIPFLHKVFEDKYNQVFLATTSINNYNIVTKFPIKKVSDVKGHEIAAAGPNLPWVTAVGAIPVQDNLTQAYTSLQTGKYEGWVMFVDATWGFKLYEVAPYYTITNFGAIVVGAITINKDVWKGLPKDVKKVLREVSEEYGLKQAQAALAKQTKGLAAMKKAGAKISTLPFSEQQKWASMLPNIPQEKADEADKKGMPGSIVIGGYIKALKAEGFKFPRNWSVK